MFKDFTITEGLVFKNFSVTEGIFLINWNLSLQTRSLLVKDRPAKQIKMLKFKIWLLKKFNIEMI